MKPMSTTCRNAAQAGFTLISALFLLLVLAALGGFIASVSTMQHAGSALDVQGARAYQAARAGTEWGLYQALGGSPSCAAGPTDLGVLDGLRVSVTCAATPVNGSSNVYRIVATACNLPDAGNLCPGQAGQAGYVERRLAVVADGTPP